MPKTDRHWSLLLHRLISTQLSISALFLMTRNHFWFLTVTYCTWPRSKQRRLAMNLNVSYSAGTPLPGVWHWALASTCFYSRPVLRARITQMPSHPPLLLQPHTYMPSHSSSPTLCGYMGTTQTRGNIHLQHPMCVSQKQMSRCLFWHRHKQKCQTFACSCFLNVMILCFPLSFMTVIEESLGVWLFVG